MVQFECLSVIPPLVSFIFGVNFGLPFSLDAAKGKCCMWLAGAENGFRFRAFSKATEEFSKAVVARTAKKGTIGSHVCRKWFATAAQRNRNGAVVTLL